MPYDSVIPEAGLPRTRLFNQQKESCMHAMSTWEMLLLGALVLLVLFWFGPGIRATLEKSRQAEQRDWTGFLLPIVLVILFVLFLMSSI